MPDLIISKNENILPQSMWCSTYLTPHVPPVFFMILANLEAGDITTGFGVVVVVVVVGLLRRRGISNS